MAHWKQVISGEERLQSTLVAMPASWFICVDSYIGGRPPRLSGWCTPLIDSAWSCREPFSGCARACVSIMGKSQTSRWCCRFILAELDFSFSHTYSLILKDFRWRLNHSSPLPMVKFFPHLSTKNSSYSWHTASSGPLDSRLKSFLQRWLLTQLMGIWQTAAKYNTSAEPEANQDAWLSISLLPAPLVTSVMHGICKNVLFHHTWAIIRSWCWHEVEASKRLHNCSWACMCSTISFLRFK